MDDRMVGLIGGSAGSVIGGMGGIIGTYFSIRNTNGPLERASGIRAAANCWLGVTAFLAPLFLIPSPWNLLSWLVYWPKLTSYLKWAQKRQVFARAVDQADS